MGTREVLGEEDEVQTNGKMFTKLELGVYRWLGYDEVDTMVEHFGRGLRSLGHDAGDNLCLYADTRMEWMVAAQVWCLVSGVWCLVSGVWCATPSLQASFRQSFPVVTMYTNLGEEAVVHGLVETESSLVITSHELLPK